MKFDYKKYAESMRKNAYKNKDGDIVVSPQLWEDIASIIESKETDDVKLTKRDLAILAAYTQHSYIGGMDNMCCFIEDLFGREVDTLDLCDKKMQKEVHERVRPLFMELCERLKKEVEN
jgi:hypothetical protein